MKAEGKKKKVLHIIQGFGAGGAETWLLSTVKYLNTHPEIGIHFDFLAAGGEKGLFDDEILALGSEIFYIRYSLHNSLGFGRSFRRLLEQKQYHAIHDHQDFISGWHFMTAAGKLPRVRVSHLHNPYNFVHNYVINPGRWFSFRAGRMLTATLASKITGTSNAVMDEYGYDKWPFKNKRVNPAYCGFETGRFAFDPGAKKRLCDELSWNAKDKIALFVGRIGLQDYDMAANQKNPAFAFAVAKELVTQHPGWRFLFAGYKGTLGESMEAEVIEAGLSDRIRFVGIRSDVHAIMSASDVFVFPSLWEGLGMVAVEAQASGLPVVMSDTIPAEAIINNDIVVQKSLEEGAGSWVSAIASAAATNIDRAKAAALAEASPFSIRNSIENLVQLYS